MIARNGIAGFFNHQALIVAASTLLISLALGLSSAPAAPAPGVGTKRALLIGINKYAAVQSLKGSVNDVMIMREVLIERWGFTPDRITMLVDEQATRDHMMAALEQIVRDSGPNDTVYIHYSGHGSQVQDLNGDEEDGLDETLVPQNGRTPGVRDIVDDELGELLAKLRTRKVLIVLDSCHSGTATRSVDIRVRSIPQDKRIDLYKAVPQSRAVVPRMESRFVVMSATSEEDEALDGPIQGQYHGFFSYALATSLSSAAPDATAREVFSGALRELGRIQQSFGRISMPEPQLEAPPTMLDQPLLGIPLMPGPNFSVQASRLTWVGVQGNANNDLVLIKGALLGATPGSTWSIYPPNETDFKPGEAIGIAVVGSLKGNDALAALTSKRAPIPAGARAVASIRPPETPKIPVRFQGTNEGERRRAQALLLKSSSAFEIVGSETPARFVVEVGDTRIKLLAADGLQSVEEFDAESSDWATHVARIALRSFQASQLLSLDNPASLLKVQLSVNTSDEPATRDIELVKSTRPSVLRLRKAGDGRSATNSLQLGISLNKDAYITVVDVDTDGDVNILFPNSQQSAGFLPRGFIKGGTSAFIPDSLKPANGAGFYWDYGPPKGVDTIRVFACADLAAAESIRRALSSVASAPNASPLSALRSDLERLAVSANPSDWAAASVTLMIQD